MTPPNEEIIDNVIIDPNLDSYVKFFDHAWCKEVLETVQLSPLQEPIGKLMLAWRSANGAYVLPWLMAESLRSYDKEAASGALNFRASYVETVIQGIVEKIESRMPSLKLDQKILLKRTVSAIEHEAFEAYQLARSAANTDVEDYWKFLTQMSEFHFCVLGLQRSNYNSVFFAYEDFIADVIRTRDPNYTSKKLPIRDGFVKYFKDKEELADFCWNHNDVDLARLVRNALVHNGGRFGRDLDKHKSRFVDATEASNPRLEDDKFNLVDDTIQITPGNTRHLFNTLKDRVTKIVEEVR